LLDGIDVEIKTSSGHARGAEPHPEQSARASPAQVHGSSGAGRAGATGTRPAT
jgi:hypothetical protein